MLGIDGIQGFLGAGAQGTPAYLWEDFQCFGPGLPYSDLSSTIIRAQA